VTAEHAPLTADRIAALRRAVGPPPEALPPDAERPMVDLELPLGLNRLVSRQRVADFRRAAVLVPVMQRGGGLHVLLTRRADHLRAHRGQISFPGGGFEAADGQLTVTALREAEEEIGLPREHAEILGCLDDYPTVTRFLVTPVVALVHEPPPLLPDANEVAEIFEIPLAVFEKRSHFRRRTLIKRGLFVPYYEVRYDGRRVWGATAGMLWNLHNKLCPT